MPKIRPFVLALALATATVAHAEDDNDTPSLDDIPHITIVGSATREVAPDLATITLGVTSRKPTAKGAADATSTAAQAVVEAAKADGIKDVDITTRALSLAQTFDEEHDPQGRFTGRRPSGFEASNTVAIRVHDLAKAGQLAQDLLDKGANAFDGIAFSVEHPQPILDELAAEAVSNARRQAEMVAKAAGVKLGRVLLAERPDAATPRPPVFASMARVAAPTTMPIEAGSEELSAQMQVTFAIDQP